MTARYVLTSTCIQTGTMALTASLRQRLLGKERVRLVDEDGEVYEGEVDWKAGVVRGPGPLLRQAPPGRQRGHPPPLPGGGD